MGKMERDLVRCAYDERHEMPKPRLESHYLKCDAKRRRQHAFAVCPYNRMHHVPKELIEEHKSTCAHRRDDFNPIDEEIRLVLSRQPKKKQAAVKPDLRGEREANDCYISAPAAPQRSQFNPNSEDPWL
jgi:hypothetical protein